MNRTLPWAIFALYPLIGLVALNLLGGRFETSIAEQLAASNLGGLVVAYWWPFLVVTELCVVGVFLISVLRNRALPTWRRILWAIGMVLLSAFVVPAYWWTYSESRAS